MLIVRGHVIAAAALGLCLPLCVAGVSEARQEVVAAASDAPARSAVLESFPPAFFAPFQPNTALDMVERIPGFTLRGGEDDERGFGVADTNFLINGRRPSTKSQSAEDLLSRIPVGTVARIEILDGDSLDLPGLSGQVVNIVARAVDLSGQWRYAARFEEGAQPQLFEGEITLSGTRGDLAFALTLESGQFRLSEDSTETFRDGAGVLIEDRTEDIFFDSETPSANLNLTWTPKDGPYADHVANLNVSGELDNENSQIRESFIALDPSRTSGSSVADNGEDEVQFELGGDYSLPLSLPGILGGLDGRLKLIGLTGLEDGTERTVFVNRLDGRTPATTVFDEEYREGESIARAEYSFPLGTRHDMQASVEYAFNFLEATTRFETDLIAPIVDDVRVEEDRFNLLLTDSWQVSPDLSVQLSLGGEYSSLQVVDPRSEARNFLRPKGFAAVSYALSDRYALRARAERSVGQLNFGTFVNSRNLTENLVTAGNDQIKPSQSWELSAEFERIDDRLLSGRIRPFLELIEDPIDRVLIDNRFEGPGNLDSALRYGVEANATLLFDTLGVPGLRLEARGEIGDSEIEDPLTGLDRQINSNTEYSYSLFTRYDIPDTDFALFAQAENSESSPFFRLDDIRIVDVRGGAYLSAGLIHKDLFGMQFEIVGTNLLDNVVVQQRNRFLGPDRRLGPLTRVERFERIRGPRLSLVLSDTF
ncbi:MAG: TonB-dependent receptor [Pseudomonadota bacterium]